jgi:glutamyl/glutaminyl-tRNA synthetase
LTTYPKSNTIEGIKPSFFMNLNIKNKPIATKIQARISTLIDNIAKDFSLDKLSKSPARFNTEKLNWFNREYIKMLSLEEFCLRSFELKLDRKFPESKLRIGDHVYLVDTEKQMVFCETNSIPPGVEQALHPVGGGHPEGLTSVENLIKEVSEETEGQIKIDQSKLLKITEFIFDEPFVRGFHGTAEESKLMTDHPKYFDGKDWTIYFYPVKVADLKPVVEYEAECDKNNTFDWVPLSELIGYNRYLTYPIWKEFCQQNRIECFEPTDRIKTQYLAWAMDKARVTTLSEFGLESDCVLNYQTPDKQLIKWKKITLEESVANLNELLPILQTIYTKLEPQRNQLFASEINDLPAGLETQTKLWEDELKLWISESGKDAGSYFWPLRTALSGKAKSPSPFEILAILDIEEIEGRVLNIIEL